MDDHRSDHRPSTGDRDHAGRFAANNGYRWQPGQPSPNPAGRPKRHAISEQLRQRLADEPDLADRLVSAALDIAQDSQARPGERLSALGFLRDSAEGRPSQSVSVRSATRTVYHPDDDGGGGDGGVKEYFGIDPDVVLGEKPPPARDRDD